MVVVLVAEAAIAVMGVPTVVLHPASLNIVAVCDATFAAVERVQ